MIHDMTERGETPVVVKAALRVREEVADGRSAVVVIGGTVGLKTVDAHLRRGVHVPTGVGPERFDVTAVAFRFAAKQSIAALRGPRVKTAGGRLRRRNGQLINLKRGKLGGNAIVVRINMR